MTVRSSFHLAFSHLISTVLLYALIAIVCCYSSFIFYFGPKANPAFAILFLAANALFIVTLFTTGAFCFVTKVSKQNKHSFIQSALVWLIFMIGCFAFFFAIDFLLHFILPELGQSLTNKLDDYKLSKNEVANNDLLPIGYQGVLLQLPLIPISLIFAGLVKLVVVLTKKIYQSVTGI